MKLFVPKILTALKNYKAKDYIADIVAGIIVAIIALPLSIALAIASGATPETGLFTAIIAGFVAALLGGSKVNITGPTAAFATIVAGIIYSQGMDGLFLATIMAGIMLVLMGVLRVGSLIKYIPHTITVGFTAGIAVTLVMLFATAATWPIYHYVLVPLNISYLQTIVFILVIATLVQFVEIILKRFIPSLFKALGVYLPLITTNCAVLGVALNNITDGYNFIESLVSSLGVGLGFLLAMVLFAGVRSRIENCPSPKAFKGLPVTLVAASIVALSFYGFAGVVENLLA